MIIYLYSTDGKHWLQMQINSIKENGYIDGSRQNEAAFALIDLEHILHVYQ